jgi:PAS domain S-box-containing protein
MQNGLLNLSFTHWGIFMLFIIPALIDIAIFVYAFFFLPNNKINKVFSVFVLLLGTAQAIDGFMRMSTSAETAMKWSNMLAAVWVFIPPFELLFVFHYTRWIKKVPANILLFFLFFPPVLLRLFSIAGLYKTTVLQSEQWNWIINPQDTIVTNATYLWNVALSVISFVLYWVYYVQTKKNSRKRNFALIIAVGNTIPFLIAITAEVILPLAFKMNDIPLSTPVIAIFSVSILIAITKYKALNFSPKHQLKNIIETMNEGLAIVNLKSEIMYANKVFCKMVGYEFKELKGQNAYNLLIKEHEEWEKVEKGLKERREKKGGQYEILMTTKSGEKKWMMLNGTPYVDEKGNVIGSLGLFTNIDALKSANKELELFIYKASHDLRGPLASILGLTMLLKHEKDAKEVQNYTDMIDTSAKKLDTILLTLIKSMQIRDTKNFEDKIDFEALLNEILQRFKGYDEFSLIEIIKNISIKGNIVSNKLILESIFQNIIENAIKYQNPETLNPYLKISIIETEKEIQIVFEDNGVGIDSLAIDKIFDMYYRGSSKAKGTGLGLYLVKNGVEKLNGNIKVESELGKGIKFIITLPINTTKNDS